MDVTRSRTQPNVFSRRLFAPLAGRYDRLAEILSMGQNRRWRTAMVEHITGSESPEPVTGARCRLRARTRQPRTGEATDAYVSVSTSASTMLRQGDDDVAATAAGPHRSCCSAAASSCRSPMPRFDALTFTYLLRYVADPAATVAELARVVKPGGPIASLEFAVPPAPWWRAAWWLYTRIVLPVAGLLTGGRAWFHVGRFLGPSIAAHYRKYRVDWTSTCGATPASSTSGRADEPRRRPGHVGPTRPMSEPDPATEQRRPLAPAFYARPRFVLDAGGARLVDVAASRRTRCGTFVRRHRVMPRRPASTPSGSAGTLVAFFLAVGVGAHALDELHGRPLRHRRSPTAR